MRHKSTELMGTIKAFVEEYYKNYRHSPSTTQIADAVGIARGTAYKYLVAMNENGMIRYDGQQIFTEQTEKVQTEFTSVALLGAVSCGAKKVLLPQTSAVDLGTVPAELMSSFSLVFYQSAEDAVFKALGVE